MKGKMIMINKLKINKQMRNNVPDHITEPCRVTKISIFNFQKKSDLKSEKEKKFEIILVKKNTNASVILGKNQFQKKSF